MSGSREAPAQKTKALEEDASFGKAYDARLLARLFRYVRPHRSLFLWALLSYPIASGLHLVQPYIVKEAVDRHFVPKVAEGFGWLVLAFVSSILLEFVARFGQTYLTQVLGQNATRDLRIELFDKLQVVDVSYIERNPIGRLMTRVTNDVESLSEMFATGAVSIVGDLVTLTGIVIMMLILDWKLTLYTFSVLPFLVALLLFFRRYSRTAFRDVRRELARLNGFLNEALAGMSLVQVFRQEAATAREFELINVSHRDANVRAIRFDSMTYAIVEGVGTIAIAIILLFGLGAFEDGTTGVGVFVAFIDYVRRFFAPITELSTKYTVMQSAMASAERCFDLLDQVPSVESPAQKATPMPERVECIRLEHVDFAYSRGSQVLHGLDLEVTRGQTVAIVGPTGAGKSTIVKLLCRFYDPSGGKVTLNGIDLREFELDALRSRFAVVLQDPYLFDASVRDNITLGREVDEARLLDAVERTRAIEVVKKLEHGFDTKVGERGSRLSSGERQLIAFARALMQDPEVLVLDEATSSVDPETEGLIQEGLRALFEGRTAVVIAHRLSTIRRADAIAVVAAGRVAELGSHDALLAADGLYRKLHDLQFKGEPT